MIVLEGHSCRFGLERRCQVADRAVYDGPCGSSLQAGPADRIGVTMCPMMKADTVTRTALVTGSGRNIGRAVALALAGQGCNVVVNGSSNLAACESVAGEVEDLGARALVAMGDIGDRNAAREICRAALVHTCAYGWGCAYGWALGVEC